MRRLRPFYLSVILLSLLVVGCGAPSLIPTPTPLPPLDPPATLRLAYPESAEPLARALTSAYQRAQPTVRVELLRRADRLAWELLAQGEADLALVGWQPATLPGDFWSLPFARDGLAVVVHPQNGIPGVSVGQLRELFQGRVEDWEAWGGLPGAPEVVSRETASGEFQVFQARIMGDFTVALTALLAPGTEAVLSRVADQQLAVGYVSTAWLDERVRPLAVDGVPPTSATLAANSYPLARDWRLVVLGAEPEAGARDFAQWLQGREAQQIITAQGWQPLTP